jgi:hypothetical protein
MAPKKKSSDKKAKKPVKEKKPKVEKKPAAPAAGTNSNPDFEAGVIFNKYGHLGILYSYSNT